MRIDSVTLRNIKTYLDLTVRFLPGVNFIGGQNGSGKTTLIEAIGLALFEYPQRDIKDYFMRYGSKSGEISVDFSVKGIQYTLVRKIGTADSRRIYLSGEELDLHGREDINAFLRELMDLPQDEDLSKLFENVIGVRQGYFTQSFLNQASERKKEFGAILKVDSYRKAADQGTAVKNHIRDLVVKLDIEIARCTGETERLPLLMNQRDSVQKTVEILESELTVSETAQITAAELLDVLKNQKQELESAKDKLKDAEMALQKAGQIEKNTRERYLEAKLAASDAEKAKTGYDAYQAAQLELDKLEENRIRRDNTRSDLSKIMEKIAAKKENIAATERAGNLRLGELQKELQAVSQELAQLPGQAEFLRNQQFETELGSLTAEIGRIRALDNPRKESAVLLERLNLAAKSWQDCQKRKAELEKLLSGRQKTETMLQKLSDQEKELQKNKEEQAKLNEQILSLKSNIERSQNGRCPFFDTACPKIELQSELKVKLAQAEVRLEESTRKEKSIQAEIDHNIQARGFFTELQAAEAELGLLSDKIKNAETLVAACLNEGYSIALKTEEYNIADELKKLGQILSEEILAKVHESVLKLIFAMEEKVKTTQEIEFRINQINAAVSKRESELAVLAEREAKLNGQKSNVLIQIQAEKLKLEDLALVRGEMQALESDKKNQEVLLEKHADLDRTIEQFKEVLNTNEQARNTYERHSLLAGKLGELEALLNQKKIETEEAQLDLKIKQDAYTKASAHFNPAKLETAQAEERNAYTRLTAARERLIAAKKEYGRLTLEIDRLSELLLRQQECERERRRTVEIGEFTQKALNILKNAGERVAEVYRQKLSERAGQIYRVISSEAVQLEWTEDYDIRLADIYMGAKRIRTFKQLSGGEQMTAALALRLGLMQLSSAKIAFFDEPTSNLDAGRRASLADMLEKIPAEFEQVFVVSHDDTFDSITQNVILLQKSKNGTQLNRD